MKGNVGTRGYKYGQRTDREGHGGADLSGESPKLLIRVLPRPDLHMFHKAFQYKLGARLEESKANIMESNGELQ